LYIKSVGFRCLVFNEYKLPLEDDAMILFLKRHSVANTTPNHPHQLEIIEENNEKTAFIA
jgi:hypothetical protein